MQLKQIMDHLNEMGGMAPTLGLEFSFDDDIPVCRLALNQSHMGAPGIAHGGAVMTLLDSALGVHAMQHALTKGKATSTVELKVNFLRPAKIGQTLYTETSIQSAGRSLLVMSGTAIDEETGKKIAFAVGTFNLYDYERSREKSEEK